LFSNHSATVLQLTAKPTGTPPLRLPDGGVRVYNFPSLGGPGHTEPRPKSGSQTGNQRS
jgi:hypothetical protein